MAKDKLLPFKIISIAALLLSAFAVIQILFSQELLTLPSLPLAPAVTDLSTIGFVEVTPDASVVGDAGVVGLTGGCYQVVANTDVVQAQSIIDGMRGKIMERPNMHDVTTEIFGALDIKILMVKIVDLKENNYIGKLIIQQGDKVLSLDSRPSDGIALAVRTNSTIYFKESLLKEMGKYIC